MENPWQSLSCFQNRLLSTEQWLIEVLAKNANTLYLSQFGQPLDVDAYRNLVPICSYNSLVPYIARIQSGEPNILFTGRPVAYEHTGGSTGGPKTIPYSNDGLADFQRCIVPWLAETARKHKLSGRAYFSISPASRSPGEHHGIPIGLPDTAYLGDIAGAVLASTTAVPLSVGAIDDLERWREKTIEHLLSAHDLELISVWSPTFLLRLLDHIPNPTQVWPHLKVVSCWASGHSKPYAAELQRRLPHAELQPKGLLSSETVITIPDEHSQPSLVRHGFFEFANDDSVLLEHELVLGEIYEVIATTASGLYRYRTGDFVTYLGQNVSGRPILEFVGRGTLICDLVGEKLNEVFVGQCLENIPDFSMLIPDHANPGYVLLCNIYPSSEQLCRLQQSLSNNPQYAYAIQLGQLAPIKILQHPKAASIYEKIMIRHGQRLGNVKPLALRTEDHWLPLLKELLRENCADLA